MSNLTDALIAAKLVGGSGGSGGGSGLPPIENVETELFNDTVAFESGDPAYLGTAVADFSTVGGQQYVINWDGTPYTCTAVDIGSGFGAVGNLAIAGAGEDTGEPFLGYAYEGELVLMTASTAASHAVSISGTVQSPSDGDILIVESGEWKTAPLNNSVWAAIGTIEIDASINIGGNSSATLTSQSYDAVEGLPESWDAAQGMVGIVVGVNQTESGVIAENINVDLGTGKVSCVFRNVTPATVSFSNKHFIKAVFCGYTTK